MRIRQISIKDYKAISEISISMNTSLIPIIGINEAGKTTILEAIYSFMPDNDDLYDGHHLIPLNIYTRQNDATIQFDIVFEDKNELHEIRSHPHETSQVNQTINVILKQWGTTDSKAISIKRHLPSKEYTCTSSDGLVTYDTGMYEEAGFSSRLLNRLPRIVYFEDFFDDIPDQIKFLSFEGEVKEIDETPYPSKSSWHSILREFFQRLDIDFEGSLHRYEEQHNPTYDNLSTHREQLEQVERELNRVLANDWAWFTNKIDDQNTVVPYEIRLEHYHARDNTDDKLQHEHTFRLRLVDRLNPDEAGAFNVRQRSKGFQWYCNFVLKLRYNPRFTDKRNHAIFLLDEPGAYLHSQAQDQLLDRLLEISKLNPIIYTTHLSQLVNPYKVRLYDCWVADRISNQITLKKYGEMQDDQNLGALTTLHNAIKLNLPAFVFPDSPKPFAITEGITEFYVFDMIKEFTDIFDDIDVSFIPGSGVTNLHLLISLAIAWSETYVVIFDKDNEADKAITKYASEFGEQEHTKHWIQIANQQNDPKVTLEKLFSSEDIRRLRVQTEKDDPKKAFGVLYYSSKSEKQEFWENISEETKDNFSLVVNKIAMIVNEQ